MQTVGPQLTRVGRARIRSPRPRSGHGEPQGLDAAPAVAAETQAAPAPLLVSGTVLLDAADIDARRWSARREESLCDRHFEDLCADICRTGGNQVPVLVRPRPTVRPHEPGYELVYGLRRLRACHQAALPVLACVQNLTDSGAAQRIVSENKARKNLAPIEEGAFLKRLLEQGMYPSLRRMASVLGIDAADASRKVLLANLPKSVLAVVDNPLRLTCAHAKQLAPLLNKNLEAVASQCKQLAAQGPMKPTELVCALSGAAQSAGVGNSNACVADPRCAPPEPIFANGRQIGNWSRDAEGHLSIALDVGRDQEAAVLSAIKAALFH